LSTAKLYSSPLGRYCIILILAVVLSELRIAHPWIEKLLAPITDHRRSNKKQVSIIKQQFAQRGAFAFVAEPPLGVF
jgi:hypothetical protein